LLKAIDKNKSKKGEKNPSMSEISALKNYKNQIIKEILLSA